MVTLIYIYENGINKPLGPDEYSKSYLSSLPTIERDQTHDLKLVVNHWYFGDLRYWVSRMDKYDGETFRIYIEQYKNGQWVDLCRYSQIAGAVDYVCKEYGINKSIAANMVAPY